MKECKNERYVRLALGSFYERSPNPNINNFLGFDAMQGM